MIDRRTLIAGSLAGATLGGCASVSGSATANRPALPPLFDDLERRTFQWFWDTANRKNGLVPDRWPSPSFCSIAAVGFALTAYPVGVERGWVAREEARDLTLATLRFFHDAPQGPARSGTAGHKGFFYHFLDMETGLRFKQVELSTVDSTILFMGMLFAGAYFDRDDPAEAEIRRLADAIYARADWAWFQGTRAAVPMGWHPETGFIEANWTGYNEGMFVYVLGLAAPRYPVRPGSWDAWTATYHRSWMGEGEARHLAFAPLFGHQYSHVWIDFRGIRDAAMREAGLDYFENSRRATYANRAYCAANPMGWRGYSRDIWGLTACDGPADVTATIDGRERRFFSYSARGPMTMPDGRDDGTIAPTAALGALPFAPEIVIPCAEALHREHGSRIYGRYGFLDSFNPSFRDPSLKVERGVVDPEHGWVDVDHLGIDQGPILLMAANHRDDFVWRRMRNVPAVREGLRRAGFTGGWLET